MKITIKSDNKYKTKVGVDIEVVMTQIEKILKKNKNLCLTCDQAACVGVIDLRNLMVKKGIRTKNHDYVFECDGYESYQTSNHIEENAGKEYRLNHPVIR